MNYDKVPEIPDEVVKPMHRRRRFWLVGLLLVAAFAAYWQWGRTPVGLTAGQREVAAQVTELEATMERLRVALAALPEGAAPATRQVLLEEAVARQDELMRVRVPPYAADAVELGRWQARLDDVRAESREQQSRALEAQADELLHQGRAAEAMDKLREALAVQQEINRGMSSRQTKSYGREAFLRQRLADLERGG